MVASGVVVFIDYQNVYRRAREKFHDHLLDPHWFGQIDPLKLAEYLVADSPYERVLSQVRIYRGVPSSKNDPRGYAATRRQLQAWRDSDPRVEVIARPLRYPAQWANPSEKPREKGIDVALALDVALMAVRKGYDVGILCSLDTDLVPALEVVCEQTRAWGKPRVEVSAWTKPGEINSRLSVPGARVYCHWISQQAYEPLRDNRDYSRA
jgi:uncharacterized LabA/DUF88 family protein